MSMQNPSRFVPFLLGLALGVVAAVYLPGAVRPYLPQWATGKLVAVKGTVSAKLRKENALLLTVAAPEGVLLATFKHKVDEISLLINEKDMIEFDLPKYMPFIDDPRIIRVIKASEAAPIPASDARHREPAGKEAKPGAVSPSGFTEKHASERK